MTRGTYHACQRCSSLRRPVSANALLARVQLLALYLIVADVVLKPTTDDSWTLVVLAAVLAVAVAAAAVSVRRQVAAAPGPAETS